MLEWTHVHRITNKCQVDQECPEETCSSLGEWLPRELWGKIGGL